MTSKSNSTGLSINHNITQFQQGKEYIMTLKDQDLLNEQNQQSNLQNSYLQDNYQRKRNEKQKGRVGKQDYLNKDGQEQQFDQKKRNLKLDQNGNFQTEQNAQSRLQTIKHKLRFAGKTAYDLDTKQVNPLFQSKISDYGNSTSNNLMTPANDQMESLSTFGGKGFRKAGAKLKKRKIQNIETIAPSSILVKRKKKKLFNEEEDQLDQEILNKSIQMPVKIDLVGGVEEILKKNNMERDQDMKMHTTGNSHNFKGICVGDNKIVASFDETQSYLNSLQTIKDKKEHKSLVQSLIINNQFPDRAESVPSFKQSKDGAMSVVNMALYSEKLAYKAQKQEQLAKTAKILEKEVSKNDLDQINVIYQPTIGKGIGGALQYLRFRGMVGKNSQKFIGRNKDERPDQYIKKFQSQNEEIRLDHRNDKGEKMTIKQSFRYMCWKFHGIKPSKKQQEKLMRKQQINDKLSKTNYKKSLLQNALQKEQKKSKLPFLVLDAKPQSQNKK